MNPRLLNPTGRNLMRRLRHRLRVPALLATGAAATAVAGTRYGSLRQHGVHGTWIALGAAATFVVLAVATVRHVADDVDVVLRSRLGPARASLLALLITVVGYAVTVLVLLGMLAIPVGQLLLGGAVTGVILGIAAQQSLGNVAAGLMLVLARPFVVGERIQIHSGALGGPHTGTVVATGLTYVALRTDNGVLQVPNAALLSAAILPMAHEERGISADPRPTRSNATVG
jgi:small-conductance mechanosensitive channel